nr:oligosaccharide flippase family protein [Lentibacillus saliphilus]
MTQPYVKKILILTSGTGLAQAIVFLASPILTRLYTPSDLGVLAVYLSTLAILASIGSLQYDYAILLPDNIKDRAHITVLSFCVLVITVLLTGTLAALLKDPFTIPDLYVICLPLGLFGIGAFNVLRKWAFRQQLYTAVSQTKVTNSIGITTIQIAGGFMLKGPLFLLAGDVLGRMIGTFRLMVTIARTDKPHFTQLSLKQLRHLASRYKKFPLLSSPSSLTRQVSVELPIILLTLQFGASVTGLYLLVQRVLGTPLNLIGTSVGNVFYTEASTLFHSEPEKIKPLFLKTIKTLFLIMTPAMIFISIVSPWAIPIIFGNEWKQAGIFIPILASMYLFQFVTIPVASTLLILERQGLQLIREIIRISFVGGAFIAANIGGLSIIHTLVVLSIAASCGFIIHGYISWWALQKDEQNRKHLHHP